MKSNKLVLVILFFMMFALIFYSRSFFANELSVIEKIVGKVQEENVRQLSRVIEAQAQINKIPWLVSRLFLAESEEKKNYIEGQVANQIRVVEEEYLDTFQFQANEVPLFEYVKKNWRGYKVTVLQILNSDRSHQHEEARERTENSLLYLERLNDGMRMIVTFHEQDVAEKTSSISGAVQLSQYNVLVLTISGAMTFLVIGVIAFRKIASTESQLRQQVVAINHLAHHDPLTGLPNRLYFQQVLSKELAAVQVSTAGGAVAFLDLDNFKLINDNYGHDIGDKLLTVMAGRIQELSNERIFAARFGGDEFMLLLKEFTDQDTRELMMTLCESIAQPVKVEGVVLWPTSSIGVAFYPAHGGSVVDLLKNADIAMYQAKVKRDRYVIYDAKALEVAATRQRLEQNLRHAIEQKEFFLNYQPIVCCASQKLVGLEALLRWNSAEHGNVAPAAFIPIAETTGMIVPIGQWVLSEAAAMAKSLGDLGLPELYISVNVSVIQFMQDDFLEVIHNTVTANKVPLDSIKIEITESVLIESFAHIKEKIDRVREMGLRVCLDDFGTGYSSLNYLTQLPLDILKLDKSLVGRLEGDAKAQAVFENLIRMAHGIGIQVVAEGVENSHQMEIIHRLGCNFAQGYYISRPMPDAALMEYLQKHSAALSFQDSF